MSANFAGEVSIQFSDLLALIQVNEDTEIARAGDNVLKISPISGNDALLMFSHPDWIIVTRNKRGEIFDVIKVQHYFFRMSSKTFTRLSSRADILTAQPTTINRWS